MEVRNVRPILTVRPFQVEELEVSVDGEIASHPFYRLACKDWVNVLPITTDGRAVLIRQPRAGSMRRTLEIPGGEIDAVDQRDPTLAAARELEEETGYTSRNLLSLGAFNPNPAIMTNRIHFFVALGCAPAVDRRHHPDLEERITIELVPAAELESLVRTGAIDHSLCCLCIMLAGRYVKLHA